MKEVFMSSPTAHLLEAIALARDNVRRGGRPFGAVVVKDGNVIARGVNEILATNDPTAHAELLALRAAGRALGTPRLDGCSVYASGHPCPMCLAAMRMAGIKEVAFAYSNEDGEPYGLSSAAIYAELAKPLAQQTMKMVHLPVRPEGGTGLYELWRASLST
ncbi:nucleoside deaminase [Archangium violaceum]|uniref:nucleoside deaminase n=1 Tax=Archangium violaceum TaxID=83451 RepID=UPI002B2B6A60|nr:nucleoside deaminase [Archangium gephyra]